MMFPVAALAISALGLILLVAAGPSYRVGVPLPTAFALLRWGAYIGLAGALAGVVAAALAFRRGRRAATAMALVAVIAGAAAAGIPFAWQQRGRSVPPIHDITTDLDKPPEFSAVVPLRADAPNSLERPAGLAEQQRQGYPDLAPLTVSRPLEEVFTRALTVAQDMGWEIVAADQSAGRIEATDTTRWFGFKDDIVVRVTPWGSGTRVDVRSVSRVGRSDVGTNARRIRAFLDALAEE